MKKTLLQVPITHELKAQLEQAAVNNERSTAGEARRAIAEYLKAVASA